MGFNIHFVLLVISTISVLNFGGLEAFSCPETNIVFGPAAHIDGPVQYVSVSSWQDCGTFLKIQFWLFDCILGQVNKFRSRCLLNTRYLGLFWGGCSFVAKLL